MSTRCRIGMVVFRDKDYEIIKSVCCHHDGYPSHVGQILYDQYLSKEKVAVLLGGGEVSTLYVDGPVTYVDKGEPYEENKPRIALSREDFWATGHGCDAEYLYLFTEEGKWEIYVVCGGCSDGRWRPLSDVLKEGRR